MTMKTYNVCMKTAELTGTALDWAVAKAIGEYKPVAVPNYSTDWAQGGPIIEREKIGIRALQDRWDAIKTISPFVACYGTTPLIAAMRCYVASKLGDNVEITDICKEVTQ
jgi:hypothetical protein